MDRFASKAAGRLFMLMEFAIATEAKQVAAARTPRIVCGQKRSLPSRTETGQSGKAPAQADMGRKNW
jgi:hypothetical protein